MKVAIFGAFPQELTGIHRSTGPTRVLTKRPFPVVYSRRGRVEIFVVETGMKCGNPEAAFRAVLRQFRPHFLISAGFGGALYPGASPGELVVAENFVLLGQLSDLSPEQLWSARIEACPWAAEICAMVEQKIRLRKGLFVTARSWTGKGAVLKSLPPGLPATVSEMEAFFLAKLCSEAGIPFMAIRAIIDTAEEELPPEYSGVCNRRGMFSPARSIALIASKPRLAPEMFRLALRARRTSEKLGFYVSLVLDILKAGGEAKAPLPAGREEM